MINEDEMSKEIASVLHSELRPAANGGRKEPTLTEEIDRVIAALNVRIKWLEAVRSTL